MLGVLMAQGLACVILGDGIVSGFGAAKLAALGITETLVIVAFFDRRFYWYPRLAVVVVAAYGALVTSDLGLSAIHPDIGEKTTIALRGLYVADAEIGYRLAPNFQGLYDDGIAQARYETNSLGHRDDEPQGGDARKVVLAGDSFAFGALLDQSQTIDKQIERVSKGSTQAYNLGVVGYGPPQILTSLQRHPDLLQGHLLYLFFNNDLRSDNLDTDLGMTVFDGFLLRRRDSDGRVFSQGELGDQLEELLEEIAREADVKLWTKINGALRLDQLCRTIGYPRATPGRRRTSPAFR